MVRRSRAAKLRHVPEDGDAATVARSLGQVTERDAHRDGIRVVGVIDQQATAGQLLLVAAPAGEVDVHGRGRRQAQRIERCERRGGVLRLMTGGEVEADAAELGPTRGTAPCDVADAHHVDVVALDGKVGGHDCSAARRQRGDQLGLRTPHALQRLDQLEMDRADVRDHADLRARNLA